MQHPSDFTAALSALRERAEIRRRLREAYAAMQPDEVLCIFAKARARQRQFERERLNQIREGIRK